MSPFSKAFFARGMEIAEMHWMINLLGLPIQRPVSRPSQTQTQKKIFRWGGGGGGKL